MGLAEPHGESLVGADGADSSRLSRLDAPFPWLLLAIIVLSCALAWGNWVFGATSLASYRSYVESLPETQLFSEALLHLPLATPSTDRVSHFGPVLANVINAMTALAITRKSWDQAARWLMLASFMASFPAIALAVAQRVGRGVPSRELGLASLCAIGIHGHFAFCGLVSIASDRYATLMLPLAVVCGLLLTTWGARRVRAALL